MRILAIQLNQPGDAILTTPALRWLMNQGHEVHALLQPLGAELLQSMPGLASVEGLPRGSIQLTRDLRRAVRYRRIGFDWAIVFLKCSQRPALWALLSGAKKRTGLHSGQNTAFECTPVINDWQANSLGHLHIVRQHLILAGAPAEAGDALRLEYRPPDADKTWATDWLRQRALNGRGYLLLHAVARWKSKYWPMENLVRFLRLAPKILQMPIVVTAGRDPFEIAFARELIAQAPCDFHELGTLTVNQLGALIEQSAGFLGVDSMPMHLAAALDRPGLALFGPTAEKIWGPWHSQVVVARHDCRCLVERHRTCPAGPESQCLGSLTADSILAQLAAILPRT